MRDPKPVSKSNGVMTDERILLAKAFYGEGLSPEEWVKENKMKIYCWSLDEIECDDEGLMNWIAEVTTLLNKIQ